MKLLSLASALAAASVVRAGPTKTEPELAQRANSMPTVTASGNAFWAGSNRFYVRGIDYQPGGSSNMSDPLANPSVCKRDIAEFKKLGINTIRVYITDNSANHDECMNALAAENIYVIIDANNPNYSINRETPKPSYNDVYLQSVFATIDNFVKYDNLMAFFSGNEVINDTAASTLSAPYVKAVTRDMRQYVGTRYPQRKVPIGYSAADVSSNRMELAAYMNCGPDDERSDFFAFNDYSWCSSDFKTSGWDQKVKNFTGYGIPIFLSEYGCIDNVRNFGEIKALMSPDMTGVYSGGLLYEYALEPNKFGIADLSKNPVLELPEFSAFAKAMSANPAPAGNGGFTSTTKAMACPTKGPAWIVDSTLLPAIPEAAKAFFKSGAGQGPGLKGGSQAGSRNPGGTSTGDASPGSGQVTETATGKNEGASYIGPMDKTPIYVSAIALLFSLMGTLLL